MPNALNIQFPSLARVRGQAANIRGAELRNVLAEEQLSQLPEERAYLRESRGREREAAVLKQESDALAYGKALLEMTTLENYPNVREVAVKRGINPDVLPQGFDSPEAFDDWKLNATTTIDQRAKALKAATAETPAEKEAREKRLIEARGKQRRKTQREKPSPKSTLLKLQEELDAMPEGDKRRKTWQSRIDKLSKTAEVDANKKLRTQIASDFMQQKSALQNALRGADQVLPMTEERQQVIEDAKQTMITLATRYVESGGDARDLGITPERIKQSVDKGEMKEGEAVKLLIKLFPKEFTE